MTVAESARVALAAVLVLQVSTAQAQSAEAEVLFRDGRRLIQQGSIAAGCDKLAASERLEPSVGTLLNLGDCREKLEMFASSWAAFRKAEAMARRAGRDEKRQAEAGRRAADVEAKLSNLVIEVAQPVEGLVVRRDDVIVETASWNTAVPVDPDTYTIVAEAPGYRPWRTEVPIHPDTRRRVVSVPRLERVPTPRAVEPVVISALPPVPPGPSAPTEPPRKLPAVVLAQGERTWTRTRKLSVGLAGLGAATIGGGIYYSVRANDLHREADRLCPLTTCGDTTALRKNAEAQDAATRANILYVAGGATIVIATLAWFAGAPDREPLVAPAVGPDEVGISFAGKF